MANKIAALLVMCLVLVAAVEVTQATDVYGKCFTGCREECQLGGKGQTFCEMKCDTDCFDHEVAGKIGS